MGVHAGCRGFLKGWLPAPLGAWLQVCCVQTAGAGLRGWALVGCLLALLCHTQPTVRPAACMAASCTNPPAKLLHFL